MKITMYDIESKNKVFLRKATMREKNTLILFLPMSPRVLHWMNPTKARGEGKTLVLFIQVSLLGQGREG